MTLRHIRIFLAVCNHDNNITRAAESLYMTQPAVSLAIHELENYYGVRLFERISRKLYITEAGKQMQEYASHLLSMFDDMERELRNWDSAGILRVGASITIGSQFMPEYVSRYQIVCPAVEVKVQVGPTGYLEKELLANHLDFALVEGVVHSPHLVCDEYMEDALVAVCAPGKPFQKGETVEIEQFRSQRLLLRESGSGTREEFDSAAQLAGFSVEPSWESTSTGALVNAAVHGLGIAVLPGRMVVDELKKGEVVSFLIKGMDLRRRFKIVYHKNKFLSSSDRIFIRLCRQYAAKAPEDSGAIFAADTE